MPKRAAKVEVKPEPKPVPFGAISSGIEVEGCHAGLTTLFVHGTPTMEEIRNQLGKIDDEYQQVYFGAGDVTEFIPEDVVDVAQDFDGPVTVEVNLSNRQAVGKLLAVIGTRRNLPIGLILKVNLGTDNICELFEMLRAVSKLNTVQVKLVTKDSVKIFRVGDYSENSLTHPLYAADRELFNTNNGTKG